MLKVAMAFGGSMLYDNRSGSGRYGMGMKAAALNFARCVDVYSWQDTLKGRASRWWLESGATWRWVDVVAFQSLTG